MKKQHKEPTNVTDSQPASSLAGQEDREIVQIRILLIVVILAGAASVLVPGIFNHSRGEINFPPQLLIGFMIPVLVIYLQLISQRRLLCEVSAALIAANSYVNRLEQVSFIDPETQLFNRMYLDQLFSQQLKSLNRTGKAAVLLLFEVSLDRQELASNGMVVAAASILRSNFRGSDCLLRNSTSQFLVLMPETTGDLAQPALDRLIDKVDRWNLENVTSEMVLRHVLTTCPPGGNLWESLREIEKEMRSKPDLGVMTLITQRPASAAKRSLEVASLECRGRTGE